MLKKRIITAAVLVIALLAVVLGLPSSYTVALLSAIVLAGAWEWSAFLRAGATSIRLLYVLTVALLLPLVWHLTAGPAGRTVVAAVAVLWWITALCWVVFAPRRASGWSAALAGILALVPCWVSLLRLRLDNPRGAQWLLFVLLLVCLADVAAFFVGRRFGRVRLAPHVSPGKTWEGVLGAAGVSALVAAAGSGWFGIPLVRFVLLCLAAVGFSVVGDLTESLLKRFAGVKDSGTLFPGHGGVMDRIDSVTGAAPVLFFGLLALGVAT